MFVPSGFPVGVVGWLRGHNAGEWRDQGPSDTKFSKRRDSFVIPFLACLKLYFLPVFSAEHYMFVFVGGNVVSVVSVTCSAEVPERPLTKYVSEVAKSSLVSFRYPTEGT